MTQPQADRSYAPDRRTVAMAVAAVLAVPAGLGLAMFGYLGWLIGPLVLALGLLSRTLGRKWGLWAIWIGAGLILGTLSYIGLGLLTPDGSPTESGSGQA